MTADPTEQEITLGAKIRRQRQQLGLSQDALMAGRYSKTYLSKVESGRVEPSDEFLSFIASQLGLSITDLAGDRSVKISRHTLEMELLDAHVAVEAKQYAKALNFLKKIEAIQLPLDLQAVFYSTLAEAEFGLAHYDSALTDFQRALVLYTAVPGVNPLQVERLRNRIGLVYYRQNKSGLAIIHHRQCLQAIQEGYIEDERFKLKIYYNLANEYSDMGEQAAALQYYKEAVTLAEAGEDNTDLAGIYWGIGLIYRNLKNLPLAKLYLNKSSNLYQEIGEPGWAAHSRNLLGLVLVDNGEYSEAEKVLQSAFALSTEQGDKAALSCININLAYLNLYRKRLDQADNYAQTAIQQAQQINDNFLLGQALAQHADIKLELGLAEEGLTLYQAAVNALEQTENREYLAKVYFRHGQKLENLGRKSEAFAIYGKAYSYRGQLTQF